MIVSMHPHFVLLQLIAAKNDDLFRLLFLECDLRELLAKGSGPARDENGLNLPIQEYSCCMSLRRGPQTPSELPIDEEIASGGKHALAMTIYFIASNNPESFEM